MKSNYKLLMWLGIILVLIPFMGIPQSWKDFALFVVGLILFSIGLYQRNHEKLEKVDEREENIFVESHSPVSRTSKRKFNEVDEIKEEDVEYEYSTGESEDDRLNDNEEGKTG